jgi:hypothetical protein
MSKLDEDAIEQTLGCISKSVEDGAKIRSAGEEKLLAGSVGRLQ